MRLLPPKLCVLSVICRWPKELHVRFRNAHGHIPGDMQWRAGQGAGTALSQNHRWVVQTDTLTAGVAPAGPYYCNADLSSPMW